MQCIIKYKKYIIYILGIALIPVILPLLSTITNVLFKLGVELGTNIRCIVEGLI